MVLLDNKSANSSHFTVTMASPSTSAANPSSAMEEHPNWLEMPHELMANILQRLGTIEILESAWEVCTTWRKICKNPEMWKNIVLIHNAFDDWRQMFHLERLTKRAVDLSCGEVIAIDIKGFGTDELLDHILLSSRKLKHLYLMDCYDITGSQLIRAVKSMPQLEELGISYISIDKEDIKVIGQNCPHLKTFMVLAGLVGAFMMNSDDNAFAIANNMPELTCLKLFDRSMTNIGLKAILEGCPHLESLDIRMCYDLDLDENLKKVCMERIKDFEFHLEIEDDDYDDDDDDSPFSYDYGCIDPSDDQEDSDYEYWHAKDPYDDCRFVYM
ncbi:hypothetical protein LXL04_027580 [Taraxacum kok-saghyz]